LIELNLNPERKQLRVFGACGCFVFAAIAFWFHLGATEADFPFEVSHARVARVVFGIFSAYCLVSILLAPALLRPLFVALSLLVFPFGLVASVFVLAMIYFGVLFPIAMVFRVLGRDSLHRTMDREASTYWVERSTEKDVKRYYRQF
jgi:hypothetical protein